MENSEEYKKRMVRHAAEHTKGRGPWGSEHVGVVASELIAVLAANLYDPYYRVAFEYDPPGAIEELIAEGTVKPFRYEFCKKED